MRAGAVGRVVVDDQDPVALGRGAAEHGQRGAHDGLDVLGLVVGREDEPGPAGMKARTLGSEATSTMPDPTNTQIAAAFDELGDLYELDGAVIHRVVAYRNAAKVVRESPRVGRRARRARARSPSCRASARRSRRRSSRWSRPATIPAVEKLRAKFPAGLIDRDAPAGPRAQARAPALRRARHRLARRAARRRRGRAAARRAGLRAQGRGDGARRRWPRGARRAAAPRVLLAQALQIGEPIVEALRAHPAADRVELAGSARRLADTVKDLDIIATARRPAALPQALRRPRPRGRGVLRAARTARARETHTGVKVDLRVVAPDQFGNLLQHFTGSKAAQRGAARGARCAAACTSPSTAILDDATGDDAALRDRGGGLRAARPGVDPARAARGPRRARGGARRRACPSSSAGRPARRPALPHDRVRRAQHDGRGDGARRAGARLRVPRDHRPLGHARVRRRRHARTSCGARSSGCATLNARARRHRAARRDRDEHPARRLARLRRRAARRSSTGSIASVHTSFGMDERR